MIKESLYIKAFDEGNLMNLKNPKPINSVWNEFQSVFRKSTRIWFRWLSFLASTFFAVISFFTIENLCVFNLPLSIGTLLGLWPAESSEEGIIICRNVKFEYFCWIICYFFRDPTPTYIYIYIHTFNIQDQYLRRHHVK